MKCRHLRGGIVFIDGGTGWHMSVSRMIPARMLERPNEFLGLSGAAERVREQIRAAAATRATVLITGESGVGKELVAREVHLRSARGHGTFVALNCAAIPDPLLESELFGHEAGAFTDAKAVHRGALERAHKGTMFLDEIGDLSSSAQPKLLRALEAGETTRVGGEQPTALDVRFVAATNHSLKAMCKEGRFRFDLYYRLCVIEIRVPPLRERIDDIAVLADHFARLGMAAAGAEYECIAPCSIPLLMAHPWRGNARELRSAVERAIAVHPARKLEIRSQELDLESDPRVSLAGLLKDDWKTARERFEAAYAAHLLDRNEHDVKKAAQAAGLVPRSLYKMLRRLGLRPGPPCGGGAEQE
jgi:DNA-binding NtrC family response regulator